MRLLGRLILSTFFNFLFSPNTHAFLALVDFEIARFRIIDKEKAAGGTRCDSDSIGPRYNPCDFVFYVKNCTQASREGGGQRCTTRINRYYASENTDDITFGEGNHPVTSFVVDGFFRETLIRIEVNDQDDGYSGDDPIGVYQLRVSPEAIDPRGQQFASITEQAILIPDHSEMTVRYRAYCADEECRARRPGLDQAASGIFRQPGRLRNDQPTEAWTVAKNGKDPAIWTGTMKAAGSQPSQQGFGGPSFGGPHEALLPPQPFQNHLPIPSGQSPPGQRPPFVEWPNGNSVGGHSSFPSGSGFPASLPGEHSGLNGIQTAPAPPENPFAPSHSGLPSSVANALNSNALGHGVEEIQRQLQSGIDQSQKGLQSASHLLGFHCDNGRCVPDGDQSQQPFRSQQHEQKQGQSQQLQESHQQGDEHQKSSDHQATSQHNQEEHPFQSQWQHQPQQGHQQPSEGDHHQDQGQSHQQQQPDQGRGHQEHQQAQPDSGHHQEQEHQGQPQQGREHQATSSQQVVQAPVSQQQQLGSFHQSGDQNQQHETPEHKLKEEPGTPRQTVITQHPTVVIKVMDDNSTASSSAHSPSASSGSSPARHP